MENLRFNLIVLLTLFIAFNAQSKWINKDFYYPQGRDTVGNVVYEVLPLMMTYRLEIAKHHSDYDRWAKKTPIVRAVEILAKPIKRNDAWIYSMSPSGFDNQLGIIDGVHIQDSATFHCTKYLCDYNDETGVTHCGPTLPDKDSIVRLPVTEIGKMAVINPKIDGYGDPVHPDYLPLVSPVEYPGSLVQRGRYYWLPDGKTLIGRLFIKDFKIGKNVKTINENALSYMVFLDTCVVIPSNVDTIKSMAFAHSYFLNGLKFAHSEKELVFQDNCPGKWSPWQNLYKYQLDDMWAHIAPNTQELPCPEISRDLPYEKTCTSIFGDAADNADGFNYYLSYVPACLTTSGEIIFPTRDMISCNRSGEIICPPSIGTLYLDREISLRMWEPYEWDNYSSSGISLGKDMYSDTISAFGPQGAGTIYFGAHRKGGGYDEDYWEDIDYFSSGGANRRGASVIVSEGSTDLFWNEEFSLPDLRSVENLSISRRSSDCMPLYRSSVKRVLYGICPSYKPKAKKIYNKDDGKYYETYWLDLWDWNTPK